MPAIPQFGAGANFNFLNHPAFGPNKMPIPGAQQPAPAMTPQSVPTPVIQTPIQNSSTPNFPFYPETDQNPVTHAATSVPSQMGDFTSWLNNVMGQQFPYGGGQQNQQGGLSGLIPGPTS